MNYFTEIAEILNRQMQRVTQAGKPALFSFGTIGAELLLSVDGLKDTIPKGDYLISLHLTGLTGDDLHSVEIKHTHSGGEHPQTGGSGSHTHDDGIHSHVLPESLRGIRPGDRVLIVWVSGQPVIVEILAQSRS